MLIFRAHSQFRSLCVLFLETPATQPKVKSGLTSSKSSMNSYSRELMMHVMVLHLNTHYQDITTSSRGGCVCIVKHAFLILTAVLQT